MDIGSGSGLFSLAARRLGATVHSFDYDPQSAACTRELKRRFFPEDGAWKVEEGSVLDRSYLESLGKFDIVYSWGVLHHTGELWRALENAQVPVNQGGLLAIAIYNDQGTWSRRWLKLKRIYNSLPRILRAPYAAIVMGSRELKSIFWAVVKLDPSSYVRSWTAYESLSGRGMSRWHDMIDWIGGFPFEVAKPEQVFEFLQDRGFELRRLRTCAGGLGCNEFVFVRRGVESAE